MRIMIPSKLNSYNLNFYVYMRGIQIQANDALYEGMSKLVNVQLIKIKSRGIYVDQLNFLQMFIRWQHVRE